MRDVQLKRIVQVLALAAAAVYCTLLLYQNVSGTAMTGEAVVSSRWRVSSAVDAGNSVDTVVSEEAVSGVVVGDPDPVAPPVAPPVAARFMGGVPTATSMPPSTRLQDLFISVKTTKGYHKTRLPVLLATWFQLAKDQTWFFTDAHDQEFHERTGGHLINTHCSPNHGRRALCCKMSVELDFFLESDKKWFCHFDDDNYVNVPRLVRMLNDFNPQEDWYLGKRSIPAPLELVDADDKTKRISFWFATGGAGFCISRALALKMLPVAGNGKFIRVGENIRLPDDVTMGYIIEHLLRKPLTVLDQFHSHLEPMKLLRQEEMQDQITFSHSRLSKNDVNVVKIDGFDTKVDPTRFLSLHCFLFPYFNFCPR